MEKLNNISYPFYNHLNPDNNMRYTGFKFDCWINWNQNMAFKRSYCIINWLFHVWFLWYYYERRNISSLVYSGSSFYVVIVGFSFCNFFGTHHGFGISALLLEWNTIFLHTRTILHLNECENKLIIRINLMLTILSWIIFRFLLAFYIVYYHFNNYTRMSMLSNIVGIFGVFVMLIINIGQAKVIYSKDIKGKRKSN